MTKLEQFKPYWFRFTWNLRNMFNNDANPYVIHGEGDFKGARRTAFEDVTHSIKNLFVEGARIIKGEKK